MLGYGETTRSRFLSKSKRRIRGEFGSTASFQLRLRSALAAAAACSLAAASGAAAEPQDFLGASDRKLVAHLGKDVVGAPVAPIDPAKLIAAITRPQTAEFIVIAGPKKGQNVPVSIRREKSLPKGLKPAPGPIWALKVPDVIVEYMIEEKDGLSAPHLAIGTGTLATSYLPPEPVLLRDVGPGDSSSYEMEVRVHPADDPEKTKYKGLIRTTYSNKGSYRIKTPAGSFDGVLVRIDFQGKLGPATMNDSDLRIYSPEFGLLGIVTHDRLHALLLVNRDEHVTLLVTKLPSAVGK